MKENWKNRLLTGIAVITLISGCSGTKPAAQAQTDGSGSASTARETAAGPDTLTLTYTYHPKAGAWSNQIAAWIENEQGNVVRTLMATRFTAQGGYQVRQMSLPVWVRNSGLAQMKASQVDALTRATPPSGRQTLVWDGRDHHGQPVPDGTYKVRLEATLYKDSDAVFSGTFRKGGQDQDIKMDAVLNQEPEQKANRDMVSEVHAVYKGKQK